MSTIAAELAKLSPSARIDLYVIDLTPLNGPLIRLHAGLNKLMQPVVWQGEQYVGFPIQAEGFDVRADGTQPRPTITASNLYGSLNAAVREYNRLVGARLIRKRTRARFLDAVNFPGGVNPDADPTAAIADDVWVFDRIGNRDKFRISWELANPLDQPGRVVPARQCRNTVCTWEYRSADCGYAGLPVAKADDTPTSNPTEDRCSLLVSGCKLRFGADALLPIGIFPGVGLLREV